MAVGCGVGGRLRELRASAKRKKKRKRASEQPRDVLGRFLPMRLPFTVLLLRGVAAGLRGTPVEDGKQYIKTAVLGDLEAIVEGMIQSAKEGKTASFRLLWELGGLFEDATSAPVERHIGLGELLLREMNKRQAGLTDGNKEA